MQASATMRSSPTAPSFVFLTASFIRAEGPAFIVLYKFYIELYCQVFQKYIEIGIIISQANCVREGCAFAQRTVRGIIYAVRVYESLGLA